MVFLTFVSGTQNCQSGDGQSIISYVKAFPHAREFYNSQAKAVMNFCRGGKIKYHIKEGTVSQIVSATIRQDPEGIQIGGIGRRR